MRVMNAKPALLDKATQDVIAYEYKEKGYKYEYWDCEYWLVYAINADGVAVQLFQNEEAMLPYLVEQSRKGARIEVHHKHVVISDVQKVIKEQLSFLDNGQGMQLNFLDTDGE